MLVSARLKTYGMSSLTISRFFSFVPFQTGNSDYRVEDLLQRLGARISGKEDLAFTSRRL